MENVEANRISFDKVTFCGDFTREMGSFDGFGKFTQMLVSEI